MALIFLLFCYFNPSNAISTRILSSLLSVPSHLGDSVITSSCNFFATSSVPIDSELSEWMVDHSRGVTIIDINNINQSTIYSSDGMRRLWQRSFCAFMIYAGDSVEEITSAKKEFHKFKIAKKALLILVTNNSFNDMMNTVNGISTEIASYDTILMSPNQTQITCQKIGRVIFKEASNLSACYEMETLLQGNDLQVSINLSPPWIVTMNAPVKGVDILILNSLRDRFGFVYHIKKETNFGIEKLANGSYVGISASMQSRESELGLAELLITPERYKYVEFSTQTYSIEMVFQTPLPTVIKSFNSIFLPMDSTGWISTSLVVIILGLTLVLIDWLYGTSPNSSQKFINISLTYATLIQLQVPYRWINYKSFKSRRVLLCFYLPLATFISMGYKSVLLVDLTFVQFHHPIHSPEDILAAGLPLLVQKSTAAETTLAGSPISIIQRLYKEACLEKNGLYTFNGTYPSWVLDLLAKGRAVGVNNKLLIDVSKNHIGATIMVAPTTVWFTKGSRIRRLFNHHLALLGSTGHLKKFLREFDKYTNLGNVTMAKRLYRHGTDAGPIKAEHFLPIFIVQGVGVILAVGIFVYEFLGLHGGLCCYRRKITFEM